ncbi:MAG: (2Fe-2S)-binding protein [Xanthomonadales bacterium]|nr:(2Fe-2S)-binding protein [Xanthomonadales bacterium]
MNMYVCVCNGVTESQIRDAVADGARNLGDLRAATGCATNCCQCASAAVDILEAATQSTNGTSEFPAIVQPA